MSTQKRLYYAVKGISIAPNGSNTFVTCHGVQSLGINTKFNLDPIFEMGQLALYENVEGIPDVEVTIEKCLDGYPLLYHQFTRGSTAATLSGRSNAKATLGFSVYTDTQENASGTPLAQCTMSGLFVQSLAYNFNLQGPSTEQVTAVGNNKTWLNSFTGTNFVGTDQPLALTSGLGGTQHRQDVLFGSAASLLPIDVFGITASGTNELDAEGNYTVPFQSIKINANLGREALYQLGKKKAYHRYVNFPVEVKSDWEVLSQTGDRKEALEDAATNLADRTLKVKVRSGEIWDLGTKNKLASVTQNGGNAQQNGGNDSLVFSYTNYNDLTVTSPQDPSGL